MFFINPQDIYDGIAKYFCKCNVDRIRIDLEVPIKFLWKKYKLILYIFYCPKCHKCVVTGTKGFIGEERWFIGNISEVKDDSR